MDKLTVGPDTIRMLELGHPWIIADSYTKRWPKGKKAGELAHLVDAKGNLLATALLDPADRIVARVLSDKNTRLDYAWLEKRLQRAAAMREQYGLPADTNAFRLVNAEGDGLPGLVIDRYADYLMVQLYCEGWRPHLELVTAVLQKLFNPAGIYEKKRPQDTRSATKAGDSRKYGRLLAGKAAPQRFKVMENGLSFLVSLEEGLDTGLFMDQRENRSWLMKRASGKRLLNLFAYTGAFSVAAAAAGASHVSSVDVSPGYTEWNRENFRANGLVPEKHRFIVGDCLHKMAELAEKKELFDMILLDPPSFSTTGKGTFSTRGGTSDLVAASLSLLAEGGLLICSSNHQKTDIADYLKELRRAALQAGTFLRVTEQKGQPFDFPYPVTFPEGRYLKFLICVKE